MGRHLTACDLSVAAIGGAPGLPDGALHPKAGQYDEKHSGENTPYSIVAVEIQRAANLLKWSRLFGV